MTEITDKKKNDVHTDEAIKQLLAEKYVESYAEDISPFKDSVTMVIIGLILGCFTLNLWIFGYIFPMIGTVLVYLGIRTLRSENLWFKFAWILSGVKFVYNGAYLLLMATPVSLTLDKWGIWPSVIVMICELALLFSFGEGIKTLNKNCGDNSAKNSALPVVYWNILLMILSLLKTEGFIIVILMIVAFVYAVKNIIKAADKIKEHGYELHTTKVLVSSKNFAIGSLIFFVVVLISFNLIFHYAPQEWSTATTRESLSQSLRTELAEKGFPADTLEKIADEDLSDLCGKTIHHVTSETCYNGDESKYMEALITSVITEDKDVKTFITFDYKKGKHASLSEGFKLLNGEEPLVSAVYKITCEKGKERLIAQVPIKSESMDFIWFGDINTNYYTTGTYSYPLFSKAQGGYMTFWDREPDTTTVFNFDILRSNLLITMPYEEFPRVERALSFFPSFENENNYSLRLYYTLAIWDYFEKGEE